MSSRFLPLVVSFLCLASTQENHAAVTLFEDDFSEVQSGTVALNTRTPESGSWSSVSGGAFITGHPNGGYLETQSGAKVMEANFTQALGSGEILRLTWSTLESNGNFATGYAGIRLLLEDKSVVGYLGSTSALANFWELATAHDAVAPNTVSTGVSLTTGNEAGLATLTYSYDTGMAWLTVQGGVGGDDVRTATLNLGVGHAIQSLRLENNGGADLRFDALKAVSNPNGLWKSDAAGSWNNATSWSNDAIPNAGGAVADFSHLNLTASRLINLDAAQTVGHLILGDLEISTSQTGTWTIQAGAGGSLILDNGESAPIIQVNNSAANITAPVHSTRGFIKTGAGSISLNNLNHANTLHGPIVVNQGIVGISGDLALGSVPTVFDPGAIVLNGGALANMTGSSSGVATQFSTGHQVTIHENRGITLGSRGGIFRTGFYGGNMFIAVNSVISGVGNLTKDDSANLIFRNANTYTGNTTINSGNFYVNSNSGSATGYGSFTLGGSTTVATILAGRGVLQGGNGKTFSISSFGTVRVGNSHQGQILGGGVTADTAAQTLIFGHAGAPENLAIHLLGGLEFDLFGLDADQLMLRTTGNIDLNVRSLSVGVISTQGWSMGTEWQLIDWADASYTNPNTLDQFSMIHQGFQLQGDIRNDGFYLVVVPEPSRGVLCLAAAGLAFLAYRRRNGKA